MKFDSNVNRIVQEIAGVRPGDDGSIWEALSMRPEELCGSEVTHINEKSDFKEKNEEASEEVMQAKKLFT